jgi:very-short-patch-repair endonuclease
MTEWLTYGHVRREVRAVGVDGIIDEIRRGDVNLDEAADAFESRFLAEWIDAFRASVRELDGFRSDPHEREIADFVRADKSLIAGAPDIIRSKLLTAAGRPNDRNWAEADGRVRQLKAEIEKKRSRKSLRKVFAEFAAPLLELKPCWMMSPLAVGTYLDSPEFQFDLVIFDEASQVRPHDAICAIYRGKQLVVAGDPQQLPPTDICVRAAPTDDDSDHESLTDHESILNVLQAKFLPRMRLRWHYRSKREELIVFSNRMVYQDELVTFPSPDDAGERPIRFVHTPDGRFINNKNDREAARVADLVFEHFETYPDQSLGVIAFSLRQQEAILDHLEKRRRNCPEMEEVFAPSRPEPFFVKNLENVQGDQRDRVILSVGYAKDDAGKLAMKFGPLNNKGGQRRLNVAITRAQHGMTVVSSMHPLEMNVEGLKNEGPKLLKAFLQFAEQGPSALPKRVTDVGDAYESPFESAVAEELRRADILTRPQIGCAGYRIDLGVLDPENPGRFLLGIECDGATYHRAATARDRDRLRQEVLEGLGWTIVRIWSTDWFQNCQAQIHRIVRKIEIVKRGLGRCGIRGTDAVIGSDGRTGDLVAQAAPPREERFEVGVIGSRAPRPSAAKRRPFRRPCRPTPGARGWPP